ncbi:T9SS type A sorting domain-containing protein [candidate division KSB1 bacterium]|nr:T9SS type A sorting domain-containing protein [candidate division KSB1 bacterium]
MKADQSYAEFPSTSGMTPGKSFWLIVKDAGKIIDTGSGRSNTTSAEFAINLHAGWNFIANPFNFPIPLSNVRMESGTNLDIRFFNGSQFSTFTGSLNPFDGYAVYSENSDRLIVDPLLFPPTSQSQKGTTGTDNEDVIWSIRIMAQCQEALDTYNFASVVSGASEGWDQHDRPEAPVIGEYVSVYFPHPEWGKVSPIYATDARPEPLEGDIWEFEVKSNIKDKVTLNFAVLESVPEDYEIWLVDDAVKSSLNLRSTQEYTFASYGKEYPKKLKLVVGKQEYIDNQFDSIDFVPESYELYQNFPNPFNPITAISYGLPFDSKVTIRIYNLLGEEIITLVNNQQTKAGYHTIIWDGRNSYNSKVATGMYIYQMISGRFIQNKKMVLVE